MNVITRTVFVIIFLNISAHPLHAQGLNNKYAIDETDIKNSLKMLGIEIYKFPLQSNDDSVYLNFIIEEYHDTALVGRSDNLEDVKKAVPAKYLGSTMSELRAGHDTSLIRMVTYDNTGGPFEIQFNYKAFSANCPSTQFDRTKYGKPQTRGFTYSIPKINERVPALVVYASQKGQAVIHCPGTMMPKDIKRRYPYTCFVYVELVKLK
jgi:hypothetical protein